MTRPSIFSSFVLLGLLLAGVSFAADDSPHRPRVGLVLGGGGARGAAHVGVLETLERLHVPVDCVAGTSMGALAAGAFAAGRSPAEMRQALAKADWNDMFQDNPGYTEINYRNKEIAKRFMPGSETGVGSAGVAYQGGVVAGQKIKLFFNRLVNADLGERNIESLPLPLSIIATDIGTGERVVYRDGSLTMAMRASMSVPGLLAPVNYRGRKLVDGGLVDNLPIAEVRERCQADVVIAVNVGSPLMKAEEVGSLFTVSAQMINILTEQNVSHSLALLRSADIYIKPDLEGIGAGDFQNSSDTADRGRVAAEAVSARLQALAVSAEAYAAWAKRVAYVRQSPPSVDAVVIDGLKAVNPVAVERYLSLKPGDPIDDARVNQDMLRIYGDGWYESVELFAGQRARPQHPARDAGGEKLGLRLSALRREPAEQLQAGFHLHVARGLRQDLAQFARRRVAGRRRDRPRESDWRRSVPAARCASALFRGEQPVLWKRDDRPLPG
ncbi:MAG: patatin-like phospholipase family protein [Propionivibrio sp.]